MELVQKFSIKLNFFEPIDKTIILNKLLLYVDNLTMKLLFK